MGEDGVVHRGEDEVRAHKEKYQEKHLKADKIEGLEKEQAVNLENAAR